MAYPPMPLHLTTPRLTLRPWTDSDVDAHRELVAERGDGMPSIEHNRRMIEDERAAAARTGIALLAVVRRDVGDFIGYCGLTVGRASADEPEIAYELFRRVHGQGYATEAASAVLDAAIETGRKRLWSTVRPWNAPSFRVLDKIGFTRDHVSTDDRGELVWLTRTLP
ncbi:MULTISPECIES: GNAT family N-acetyltransferase [unclassified Streptomyces]|jgi:RimJ/RimL family protein N-acetyltransferase|uniref:GNAT family N-acetyltransferase n=1 Tax=unclassified Streptomyces TaxID=2593676 RepID=UPI00081BA9DE|nr:MULTISPECIES: GNAT family N-acetyltransferase [unclassified Streptomyces]MYQ82100.1 GNAT family N-acetyltransferase [Streptomyces sp. SID4936]SCD28596.1 Protein N-acetyltransferase, RimJ/RimL family [Streptomyces sp. DvalAA-43]